MNKVNVDISANVEGFVSGINQATQSAEKYNTETKKIADATGNFRKEFAAAKKDVMNLASAYRGLTAEEKNSQFGKEMAKQLEEAKQKASEYLDIQSDMQQELRNLASDTATFDSLSQGVNVFMQTTSAALGVVAQFTGNEEDARRAVVMFTTAQSVLNSVTAIQNALQKQSALMLGVTKVQTLAATAAENLSTAAKSKNIVVTKAATIAQAAFNKVAMMNPYVLLATAVIAVGTALWAFASASNKAKEEQEAANKAAEEAKKKAEEEAQTRHQAALSYIESADKLKTLKKQYESVNDEMSKKQIIDEATAEFKKLGFSVNSADEAQKLLVENGEKVIQMLKLQADAAAVSAVRMELLKEKMLEIMKSSGDSASDAYGRAAYMLKDKLDGLDKQVLDLNTRARKIAGELKKNGVNFKSGSNKSNSKTKVDIDKGSLADLEAQYSKLQEKLKKKNLSAVDVQKTLNDMEDLKKQIEAKKIELGTEPDPKSIEGTLAYFQDQIKKLEDKKAKLKLDAYVERQQIQDQIDGLQLKIKLETEGVTKTGHLGVSDALLGNYKKNIPAIEKAISDLKARINEEDWNNPRISLVKYTEKIKELEKEKDLLQKTQDKLTSSESEFTETLNNTMSVLSGVHAIDNVVNSFENLSNALGENANAWDAFMAIIQVVESVMAGINTVTEVANLLTEKSAVNKAADAAASGAAASASATQAAAETASVAPAAAATAANKALEASVLDLAAAQIFAAHAAIPFAGVGIASGLVTSMLSAQAAAKAAIASMQAFAEGGIVQGGSYSGDRLLVRANAGEMILNNRQQKNLFDLLDTGAMPTAGGTNVQVTGVIKGTDIMLVQKNTSKVLRKTGTKISF